MSTTPRAGARIAVIGLGSVGASCAYVLLNAGLAREMILCDRDARVAEGQMMDLQHCLPYGRPARMDVRAVSDLEACDVIILAAGARGKPGESRLQLLERNAEIVRDVAPRLHERNPGAVVVVITNPVDVMARLALELSGYPPEQVISTGTVLDSARFRWIVSRRLAVDPRNVHAYVIGEHGDSEVAVWSRVTVGPYGLDEFCAVSGRALDRAERDAISTEVRRAAYEIIARKGATCFAIGVSTLRICESILGGQRTLQTVSRRLTGAYGIDGTFLSLPCVVSSSGVEAPLELTLSEEERGALMRSAAILDEAHAGLRREL